LPCPESSVRQEAILPYAELSIRFFSGFCPIEDEPDFLAGTHGKGRRLVIFQDFEQLFL
jgi:hypothetical protein